MIPTIPNTPNRQKIDLQGFRNKAIITIWKFWGKTSQNQSTESTWLVTSKFDCAGELSDLYQILSKCQMVQ